MADTRRDKRAPVALKVRFKSATLDEFVEQYAQDISRGGAFIKSKKPMAVGTLLKFEFRLQDDSSVIRGVGRVVWQRPREQADAEHPPGMGIKFIKMDAESRALVERIVARRGGAPGRFDRAEPTPSGGTESPAAGSSDAPSPFFPPSEGPPQQPPPEDRTVVRHASQFLAQALAEVDEEAAAEARARAEEAERRARAREEAVAEARARAEERDHSPSEAERSAPEPEEDAAPPAPEAAAPEAPEERAQSATTGPAPDAPEPEEDAGSPAPGPEPVARDASADTPSPHSAQDDEASADTPEPKESASPAPSEDTSTSQPPPEPEAQDREQATLPPSAPPPAAEPPSSSPLLWVVGLAAAALLGFFGWRAMQQAPPPAEPPPSARPLPSTMEPTAAGHPEAPPEPEPGTVAAGEPAPSAAEPEPAAPSPEPTAEQEPAPAAAQPPAAEAEQPTRIEVRIVSRPPGATIRIDGAERGEAPLRIDLPEGRPVTVEARLRGHRPVSQRWTPSNTESRLRLVLEPLPVVVAVTSTPPGARVRIGDQHIVTPGELKLPRLPSAPLRVTATLPGHRRQTARLAPAEFQETGSTMRASLSLTLAPLPEAPDSASNAPRRPTKRPAARTQPTPSSEEPARSGGQAPKPPPSQPEAPGAPAEPLPDNPF